MASKKPSAKKKANMKTAAAAKVASVKSVTLHKWLNTLHQNAKEVAAAGATVGACLLTDPHTGTESCVLVDQQTCKALKGTFIGGPCGP